MVYTPVYGHPDAVTWLLMLGLLIFLVVILKPFPRCGHARRLTTDVHPTKNPGVSVAMAESAPKTGKRYVILGTGQVGMRIVEVLLMRGERDVRALDIVPPNRELRVDGASMVKWMRGDIRRLEDCTEALEGADVVFLTIGLICFNERLNFQSDASYATNVLGTENVIAACIECSVSMLIQTSASSVFASDENCQSRDVMNESTPYVTRASSPSHFGWTMVEAERRIIEADGTDVANGGTLHTALLRLCSWVFGPDDTFFLEKFMRDGSVTMIYPEARADWIFIDNCVWGHLLLEAKLSQDVSPSVGFSRPLSQSHSVHGQTFCVSNLDPCTYEDLCCMVQQIVPSLEIHYAPRIPLFLLTYMVEAVQWLTRGFLRGEIALVTPATLNTAKLTYTFDCTKAESILGYKPIYSLDEGVRLCAAQWKVQKPHGATPEPLLEEMLQPQRLFKRSRKHAA
eukprot:TRINITY_DN56025_c0_g1_i1.p1 TRINITY_DN56025_c0_g1~~TRINITY_DN56025_c0_g1_i1.p1  ORF type:complete len:456 (+),score=42.77 TRINITY_DN56025_c0_g1_i1:185-1552(+)